MINLKRIYLLLSLIATAVISTIFISNTYASEVECISENHNDIDGDNIPNDLELNGINVNNDSVIDLDLNNLGASPFHKDLFLEIDYMKDHKPYSSVIPDVVSSFANAPLCNPDGISGINLHVELDEEIPEVSSLDLYNDITNVVHFNEFNKTSYFGSLDQRTDQNSENILDAKSKIFHYAKFIHTYNNSGSSGIAHDIPAMDFVVSLGHNSWPKSQDGHNKGTATQQKGTLMHEFGHTLGIGHGGGDHNNFKPNYLSIMNYYFQFPTTVSDRPLDYSRCALNSLDERSLDEPMGLSQSCPDGLKTVFYSDCAIGAIQPIQAGGPIDWNVDLDDLDQNIIEDANCDSRLIGLASHDDWNNIVYLVNNPSNNEGMESLAVNSVNSTVIGNQTSNNNNQTSNEIIPREMTVDDAQKQLLGLVAGIDKHIERISDSSFQVPTVDSEGNIIPSDTFSDQTNASEIGKGYYKMVLGTSQPDNGTERFFGDEAGFSNITSGSNTIVDAIKRGDYDAAISYLDEFTTTSDSSLGGSRANDFISDPNDQKKLIQLVTNAQNALKGQTCNTPGECE
jgi:hypothetical protein